MESYVLVVLPPKDVGDFVDGYRKRFAKYTRYSIPPHITIYPPFESLSASTDGLISDLQESYTGISTARISFTSIDYFEGKNNVAYFKPDQSSASYIKELVAVAVGCLRNKIRDVYPDYHLSPHEFSPHMTIAEHIPEAKLAEIKSKLEDEKVQSSFMVNSVFLFKKWGKRQRIWEQAEEISLGE